MIIISRVLSVALTPRLQMINKDDVMNFPKILLVLFGLSTPTVFAYESHTWASAEYLYAWVQNSPISVPLVTQNKNPVAFGFINEPGTRIIFGAGSNRNAFNLNAINGGRVTIGSWIDKANRYGIEGTIYSIPNAKNTFSASSVNSDIPIINIPFFSTEKGENVLVNRLPNKATISDRFQTYGYEVNGLYHLTMQKLSPLVLIAGFRYLNINEDFKLNDALFNAPSFPNSIANIRDNFYTKNQIYGFQIGANVHYIFSNIIFEATAKIAIGNNNQKLKIQGQTNVDNQIVLQPIGLFAETTNSGKFKNNQIAFVPEFKAKLAYQVNKLIRPFIAYEVIYVSKVIRPGRQIDREINQSQNTLLGGDGVLSGKPSPSVSFKNNSMYMQMLSAGVDLDI